MINDVLVTDQLNIFIVFYETYGQPERRLCPLVVSYMAPGPSVQCGMGPLASEIHYEVHSLKILVHSVFSVKFYINVVPFREK